jgi:hypothetical protein
MNIILLTSKLIVLLRRETFLLSLIRELKLIMLLTGTLTFLEI